VSEPRYLSGDEYAHTGVELDIVKCKECASEYDYAEYHSYTCSDCEDKIIKREKERERESDMNNVMVYKLDKGGWAVALNPTNECVIWHFDKKKQATEKARELEKESK